MDMSCNACGKRFRSMIAEARHRHNFPALCTRNAQFKAWSIWANAEAVGERIRKLEVGTLFRIVTTDAVDGPYVVYERLDDDRMECVLNTKGERPGDSSDSPLGAFDIRRNIPNHWLRIEPLSDEANAAYRMLRHHDQPERANAYLAEAKDVR